MADTKTLSERAYAAFYERNVDGALAFMSDDMSWPKVSEGSKVVGSLGYPIVERDPFAYFVSRRSETSLLDTCPKVAAATSPPCQPTTDRQDNLDRIEHTLHTCFTRFTGKDHR